MKVMTPWAEDDIDKLRYRMSERKLAQALRATTMLEIAAAKGDKACEGCGYVLCDCGSAEYRAREEQAVQTRWDARPVWFRDLLDKYEAESSKYALTVLECLDEYDGEWTSQGVAMALADWAQTELEQCGGLGTSGDDELVGYLGGAANELCPGTF